MSAGNQIFYVYGVASLYNVRKPKNAKFDWELIIKASNENAAKKICSRVYSCGTSGGGWFIRALRDRYNLTKNVSRNEKFIELTKDFKTCTFYRPDDSVGPYVLLLF